MSLITFKCSVNSPVNCEVVEIPSPDVIWKTRNDYTFCTEDQTFVLIFLKFSCG